MNADERPGDEATAPEVQVTDDELTGATQGNRSADAQRADVGEVDAQQAGVGEVEASTDAGAVTETEIDACAEPDLDADPVTGAAPRTFEAAIVVLDPLSATSTLPRDAGMPFDDLEHGPGRVAFLIPSAPAGDDAPRVVLALELTDWSVSAPLTSGQLHRLINGLAGRGRRNTVRPLAGDERHVYLAGTPEQLTIEYDGRTVHVPAGPRRGLSKALRAVETGEGPGAAAS